jgi:hypothetical protein
MEEVLYQPILVGRLPLSQFLHILCLSSGLSSTQTVLAIDSTLILNGDVRTIFPMNPPIPAFSFPGVAACCVGFEAPAVVGAEAGDFPLILWATSSKKFRRGGDFP